MYELYAGVEPYASNRSLVFRGQTYERIRNTEDSVFTIVPSAPMKIVCENDGIFAPATIGIVTIGSNGVTGTPTFR